MGPILLEGQVAWGYGTVNRTVELSSFESRQDRSKATLMGCPDCDFRPPRHLGFQGYIGLLLPLDDSNKSKLARGHKHERLDVIYDVK